MRLVQKHWRPSLKARKHWAEPCVAWIRLVLGKVCRSSVIQTSVYTSKAVRLGRRSGLKGLTLYLKTCHVLLLQSLPGTELRESSRAVGKVAVARCHDGIPSIIPAFARSRIRAGCKDTLRLWLTLFGVYRVIEYIGKADVSSIVKRGTPIPRAAVKDFYAFLTQIWLPLLEEYAKWVPESERGGFGKPYHYSIAPKRYDPRASASADSFKLEITNTENEKVSKYYSSFATRGSSATVWLSGSWGPSLLRYAKIVLGITGAQLFLEELQRSSELFQRYSKHENASQMQGNSMGINGRLVGLQEPAGKVRIIALVDYWTQHLLLPLHDEIFKILSKLPTDGTFDQLRPVKRLLGKIDDKTLIWSYDLKSATDRLSIKAQMMILTVMFSVRLACAWRALIVGRTYWYYAVPSITRLASLVREKSAGSLLTPAKPGATGYVGLRYAQGQPMGAYSSWAMLALTHHAMVQWAAYMEGFKGWFDLYAVLGDDIIIAHPGVARRYVKICEWFGVEIGLAKSLISNGKTCEFAKKLFFKGEDCSGLPLKFWAASQINMSVVSMLLAWYPHRSIANFVRALGVGFKGSSSLDKTWDSLPRRLRVLMVYLTHPLHMNRFAFSDYAEWLWAHGPNRRWSPTDDGMVDAKPWLVIVTEGVINRLRDLIMSKKRQMVAKLLVRDAPVMNIHARAYRKVVEFEHELEEFAGTLEDAYWKWNKRSLNRIAEYAERLLDLQSKAGGLPAMMQDHIFRVVKEDSRFNVSKIYKEWQSIRCRLLSKAVDKISILRPVDDRDGDDW